MQQLWVAGVGWDDEVSELLVKPYMQYRNELKHLSDLRIPRWLNIEPNTSIQICGFADASEMAYAAVVYLRTTSADITQTIFLVSKPKVAPINQITLPRLELCAAHLLVKLITKVKLAMNIPDVQTIVFTDSTVVLAWLKALPRK